VVKKGTKVVGIDGNELAAGEEKAGGRIAWWGGRASGRRREKHREGKWMKGGSFQKSRGELRASESQHLQQG